jgi:AcrR family transcriptional regulator
MVHMNKRSGPASKERILKEATKVFSEHGYEKSSMRMIAKASNISIGGLYLYFKNKEDLYTKLTNSWMDDYSDKLKKALSDVQDPIGQIKTYIVLSINYAKKHRELILFQGRELSRVCGTEAKKKFFKKQSRLVENIILRGIKTGVFRKCNVKETAKVIRGAIRGFIFSIIVEEDALFSPEECSNLILNGLMRRERT